MMESSQGGAEAVSSLFQPSLFQPYRILYFVRAKGGARAPCAPPWIRHCVYAVISATLVCCFALRYSQFIAFYTCVTSNWVTFWN